MERIYRKHMENKHFIYLFLHNLWVVGSYCGFLILAERLNNSPIRCNKLTTLPLGDLMGLTRRSMKNRPLEMRWKVAWVD